MNEYEQNIEIMKELRSRIDTVLSDQETLTPTNIPDPTKHKYISFVKSGFRIVAGGALVLGYLEAAGLLLIVAEVLGILEEMV
jgi:hypothetical protein